MTTDKTLFICASMMGEPRRMSRYVMVENLRARLLQLQKDVDNLRWNSKDVAGETIQLVEELLEELR